MSTPAFSRRVEATRDGGQWSCQVLDTDGRVIWEGFCCEDRDSMECACIVALALCAISMEGQSCVSELERRGITIHRDFPI